MSVQRLNIAVITPLFPTADEPYRGAPIWKTLTALKQHAGLRAWCPLPRHPRWLQPRSGRYRPRPVEASAYGIPAETVEYPAIPALTRRLNGRSIARRLEAPVAAARPDLILAYWIHPDGYAAVRLGEKLKVPVVLSSRGSDLRQYDRLTHSQTAYAVSHAAGLVCVSRDLAGKAVALGADPARVHTIVNGVDDRIFHPAPRPAVRARLGLGAEERWVLFVGWLSELKGVPELFEAVDRLNRSGRPVHLALAGEGHLGEWLRTQIGQRNLSARVRLLGPLNAPQVADWLNASDLLCLPSRSEGCPNVIVEALNCGCPVVATAVGGIPELVDESSARLILTTDAALLADALEQALEIRWNREAIWKSQHRSWEDVARETYEVCRQAAARNHS